MNIENCYSVSVQPICHYSRSLAKISNYRYIMLLRLRLFFQRYLFSRSDGHLVTVPLVSPVSYRYLLRHFYNQTNLVTSGITPNIKRITITIQYKLIKLCYNLLSSV